MTLPQIRCLLGAALGLGFTSLAGAHDPGLSGLSVTIRGDHVEAVATFARADVQAVLGTAPDRRVLLGLAPDVVTISQANKALVPDAIEVDPHARNNDVEFRVSYPTAGSTGPLTVRSPLIPRLAPGHRQYFAVHDAAGHQQAEQLFRADANSYQIELSVASASAPPPTFLAFLRMGIEHILTGYDHLLFLGALLLVSRNFSSSLKIISCFTVGHSITLALATLNVVNLSSRLVEPLIAASIIYVGVENFLKHGEPRGRYLLTFAFGLVHGLGFASALREMGVGANGGDVALPLLGFNLGVELGQLSVAAVVLPIFWSLRRHPIWVRRWVPVCSALVALAGAYWLVERVTGLGG